MWKDGKTPKRKSISQSNSTKCRITERFTSYFTELFIPVSIFLFLLAKANIFDLPGNTCEKSKYQNLDFDENLTKIYKNLCNFIQNPKRNRYFDMTDKVEKPTIS